jgi:predicted dehydrogenase
MLRAPKIEGGLDVVASTASPARVGLLGYGLAGRVFHAPLVAATPGLRLAAIVTSDPDRQARAGRDHPDAAVLARPEDLWDRAIDLDLVVVATPNRSHVPLALAAIERGVAVVVDKPLAPTAAEARDVLAAAERSRVPLTVFQNRRWDGDFLTVRRLVGDGALGRVLRFESRFERWRPEGSSRGWRDSGDPADAGGVLVDLGAHLVDQAILVCGPVAGVVAELDRRRPGAETDDDAFVALEHASGVRSHLWMSTVAAQAGPRFRVLGDRAAYTTWGLDPQEDALAAGMRPGDEGWGELGPGLWGSLGIDGDVRLVPTERGRYETFYAGVAATLRDGAPLPVDPADSIGVLDILEAARRSAMDGMTVRMG